MSKQGKNLKFYLSLEDQVRVKQAMEEAGFGDRGPYLMYLIGQQDEVNKWRREAAREVQALVKRFKLREKDYELAAREV